jgi:hypothetical protein
MYNVLIFVVELLGSTLDQDIGYRYLGHAVA